MELLEGESLERYLASEHFSWRRALEIGVSVAGGLASAHGKGLVHRDLKPANIFITEDGLVKLLDFGLATEDPFRSTSPTANPTGAAETEFGAILGTVAYMSPEQVRGERADHRSDIFSLGCVLYEMLTGRRPFGGRTAAETLAAILRDQPSELAADDRQMPPGVDGVVRRCLEKNPGSSIPVGAGSCFHAAGDSQRTTNAVVERENGDELGHLSVFVESQATGERLRPSQIVIDVSEPLQSLTGAATTGPV